MSYRLTALLLSLETVFKSYCFQSFLCRCKVKMQRKVCGFDKNDMKTYQCRRGLKEGFKVFNDSTKLVQRSMDV